MVLGQCILQGLWVGMAWVCICGSDEPWQGIRVLFVCVLEIMLEILVLSNTQSTKNYCF